MTVDPRLPGACARAFARLIELASDTTWLLARLGPDATGWRGPAAGRAEASIEARRSSLRRISGDLEEAAGAVRRMGAWAVSTLEAERRAAG